MLMFVVAGIGSGHLIGSGIGGGLRWCLASGVARGRCCCGERRGCRAVEGSTEFL